MRWQEEQEGRIDNELAVVLSSIAVACKQIASMVNRAGISNLTGLAGEQNISGEDQKKLDIVSNEVFSNCLRASGRTVSPSRSDFCTKQAVDWDQQRQFHALAISQPPAQLAAWRDGSVAIADLQIMLHSRTNMIKVNHTALCGMQRAWGEQLYTCTFRENRCPKGDYQSSQTAASGHQYHLPQRLTTGCTAWVLSSKQLFEER